MEALKNLKINEFEKNFQEIMLKSTSNWDTSKEAISQIENKKYDVNLKARGIEDITFVGVAFYGKMLKVSYK